MFLREERSKTAFRPRPVSISDIPQNSALHNLPSRWQHFLLLHLKVHTACDLFSVPPHSCLDEPTCSMSLSRSTFLKTVNQNSGMPLGSSFSSSFFSSSNLAFSFISSCVGETFPLQHNACSTASRFKYHFRVRQRASHQLHSKRQQQSRH